MDKQELNEKQFASFCCKVIKHSLSDFFRQQRQDRKHNVAAVSFEDLKKSDIADNGDTAIKFNVRINILHKSVTVENEALAAALNKLPLQFRDIVLMYYFLDLTDNEISSFFGIARQRIWEKRQRALKKITAAMTAGGQNER